MRLSVNLLVVTFGLFSATIATADTMVAVVHGTLFGHGDTGSECCANLRSYHSNPGNITDMTKECRALRGDVVKNIVQDPGGYCAPQIRNGAYKYECSAASVGDCMAF